MRTVLILAVALVAFVLVPVAMAGGGCAGSEVMCASFCSPSCGTETSAGHEPFLEPGVLAVTPAPKDAPSVPLKPLDAPKLLSA